jgi:hypothetical protein
VTDGLERRYRRLMSLYPSAYRAEYEEDMLGVLLARARPGQRWPGLREASDLLLHAGAARFRRDPAGGADRRWRDAAAVAAVLAPIVLLTVHLAVLVKAWGFDLRLGSPHPPFGPLWIGRVVVWALVVVAVLTGVRVAAAGLAWLDVAVEAVRLGDGYLVDPVAVLYDLRPLLLAAVAAAVLSVPAPPRRGATLLGWRRLLAVGLAAVTAVFAGLLELTMVTVYRVQAGMAVEWSTPGGFLLGDQVVPYPIMPIYAAAAIVFAVVVVRLGRPLRRRLTVLALPAVALYLLIRLTFNGFIVSSPRFYPDPVLLVPAQWVALAATPVAAFLLGALLVHRAERRERLIELGRQRERELTAG